MGTNSSPHCWSTPTLKKTNPAVSTCVEGVCVCVCITHSVAHDLHGDGKHDGRASLSSDGVQGLKVTQLEGSGRGNHVRSFLQSTGGVELTLGGNNLVKKNKNQSLNFCKVVCVLADLGRGFTSGLSLGSHGSLHLSRQTDILAGDKEMEKQMKH